LVPWYHGTMNTVATNVRFSQDEYSSVKALAQASGKSVAAVIREALKFYQRQAHVVESSDDLIRRMEKVSVKIDVPVIDLVREGRKFDD